MIFNMGGAIVKNPKKFGLYAWRKYAVSLVQEDPVSNITESYIADPNPEILKVYSSSSMETDEENGLFTLVNPDSWDLSVGGAGLSISINKYFMFSYPSGSVAFKSGSFSSQRPSVYFTTEGALINPSHSSYPVTKYSFEYVTVHTFDEFVVSDDPEEYPDGGEIEGYYYEKI